MELKKKTYTDLNFGDLFAKENDLFLKMKEGTVRFGNVSWDGKFALRDTINASNYATPDGQASQFLACEGTFMEQFQALKNHIEKEEKERQVKRKRKEMFVNAMKELDNEQKDRVLGLVISQEDKDALLAEAEKTVFVAVMNKLNEGDMEKVLDLVMPRRQEVTAAEVSEISNNNQL